jgi:uncharacterized damage-inducible protein DinB
MISLDALRDLFDYNYWARDRQLDACGVLTGEQFVRPMGGSFSSVRDTLAHLVAVERIWLERWLGKSPTQADAQEIAQGYAAGTFPDLAVVRERWQSVEHDLRAYLARLDEGQLKQPLTYTNVRGERWTYPLGETLFHVVNHQTYHRGQIATLLRQIGAGAPGIDYLVKYESEHAEARG